MHQILSNEITPRPLQPQSSDTHEYIGKYFVTCTGSIQTISFSSYKSHLQTYLTRAICTRCQHIVTNGPTATTTKSSISKRLKNQGQKKRTCATASAQSRDGSSPPWHGLHTSAVSAVLVTSGDKGPLPDRAERIMYDAIWRDDVEGIGAGEPTQFRQP